MAQERDPFVAPGYGDDRRAGVPTSHPGAPRSSPTARRGPPRPGRHGGPLRSERRVLPVAGGFWYPDDGRTAPGERDGGRPLRRGDRTRLLRAALAASRFDARLVVDELLAEGIGPESVLLDLLPRTARDLGALWDEDLCDLSEVTIAVGRLHEVLREQGARLSPRTFPAGVEAPRVLLATPSGDPHMLGLGIAAQCFWRRGWRVWSEPGASREELADIVAREHVDLLGFSVARSAALADLAEAIVALRRLSRNPAVRVLVGGRLLGIETDLVARLGADAGAFDPRTAPDLALRILARTAQARRRWPRDCVDIMY